MSMKTRASVSDKEPSLPYIDVGLALKLQSTESFPEKMMMVNYHNHDYNRPFSPSSPSMDDGNDKSGPTEVMLGCCTNINRDDDAAPATTPRAVAVGAQQQPFDISTTTTTTFKFPGGMAAATLGYYPAFTSAQWNELERQAMIYKYMVASVPVPPDLLLPFTPNLAAADSSANSPLGTLLNLKCGNNNKDPEAGRCKRTDGKKWRCSRDVAPHQKYCERHMHRGRPARPRSRKPVEVPPNTTTKRTRITNPRSTFPKNDTENPSSLVDNTKHSENISATPYREQPNRGLDWMMEGEMVKMDTSEPQWQQLTEGSIYSTSNSSIFRQDYVEEPMNLPSLPDIGNSQSDEFNFFLNPYEPPRDFIDAWSNQNNMNESSVTTNGNLSPSSLNLSMAMAVGSSSLDEESGQIQMGLGLVSDTHHHHHWLNPVSWMGSTLGGPLAEVLGSPYAGNNGDAISPPANSASSPSGVLQRTMLSLSDSSVCNSPTVPESVGFRWLS